MGHTYKQFGWLAPTLRSLPQSLVKKIDPQLTLLFNFQDVSGMMFLVRESDSLSSISDAS